MSETEDKLAEAFFDKHMMDELRDRPAPKVDGDYVEMPVCVFRPKVIQLMADFARELTEQRVNETLEDCLTLIVRDVAELPDRSSPEDWPEAMLVTDKELREIVRERIEAYASSRLAEVTAQLEQKIIRWKSRAKKFQTGYNDKFTEATALLIQKLQLEADGATPVLIRQRNKALERTRNYLRENATLRAELERLTGERDAARERAEKGKVGR